MEIRITFRSEVYISGDSLSEITYKWEAMKLYQDGNDIEFIEISSVEDAETYDNLEHDFYNAYNNDLYSEVRSNYYDEEKGAFAIDVWKTHNCNEHGKTVAYVYNDGNVEWIDENASNSNIVNEEIQKVLLDIAKDKVNK
jgi:hypothetical protein